MRHSFRRDGPRPAYHFFSAHGLNDINGTLVWHSGSTCNAPCGGDGAWSARLIGIDPWSMSTWVLAEGVRNSWEGVWVPEVGYVFTDNGKDWQGDWPPEEINLLLPGAHYGWDESTPDDPVPAGTVGPIGTHTPHSSINGIDLRPNNNRNKDEKDEEPVSIRV